MAVDHNNPQSRDEEILIATIDGKEYDKIPQSRMEELLLELKEVIEEGGGGGGTSDYENLSNQPQINGETLIGDKTGADLGLVDAVEGKDLSTNDYDDNEKAAVAAATSAISAMKDGTDLDSFGDVEVALLDKADVSDLGTAAAKDSTNVVTSGSTDLVESGAVKDAIDVAVAAAYHHAGTKTVAQLTHDLLIASNEGNVYNITDSGTTTSDFIEGIGKTIDEGSNVGICKVENTYMFDLLSGFVDTTNFVQKSQTAGLLKNDGTVDTVEKQPKTDNNLTTTSKDTTGAINEVNSGVETLDAWTSADTKTVTGNPITISDAAAVKAKDLSMSIVPDQDLHGFDHPWVGGAGKNILPLTLDIIKTTSTGGTWSDNNTYVKNGVTFKVNTDNGGNVISIVAVSGTASGTADLALVNNYTTGISDALNGKSVILNGCPSGGGTDKYNIYGWRIASDASTKADNGNGVTFNAVNTTNNWGLSVQIYNGYTIPTGGLTFYPMIRLATETDATFAPYTNICPISGHTEAVVTRSGVNLLSVNSYSGSGTWLFSKTFRVTGNYLYRRANFSTTGGAFTFNVTGIKDGVETAIDTSAYSANMSGYNDVSNYDYVKVSGYSNNASNVLSDVMMCFNDNNTDTIAYEPYKGQQYTLALGDTIYGGTVDFETGKVRVTKAIVDMGTLTWGGQGNPNTFHAQIADMLTPTNDMLCSAYPVVDYATAAVDMPDKSVKSYGSSSGRFFILKDTSYSSGDDAKTGVDGIQLCYPLTTPIELTLTPAQLELLKGHNTITANGATISLTYQPDNLVGEVMEQVDEKIAEVESKIVTENTLYDGEKVPINFNLPASASMKPLFTGKYGIDAGVGSGDLLNIITSKTPIDLTDVDTIEFVGLFNNWELSSSFIYDVDVSAITGSKYISIGYESTLQNAGVVYAITDTDTVTSADCTRIKTTTGANTISLFTKIALL